ncbi:MAG: cytochrome c4 [Gammaproteobacteria bacterium]|nr:cytochrome c4 [Gammaproteobacteria bacterium]
MNSMISYATRIAIVFTAMAPMMPALAEGDVAAGQAKAAVCGACHGLDGNSANPVWPSLAGQHASYIVNSIESFKNGTRSDVLMTAQANILSPEDTVNVAAYYAAQTPTQRTADPALADLGERIYRGGDKKDEVSACIACHGPSGRGNAPAGYPSLTGQHAIYTAKQLADYKSGARSSDGDTQIMRNIAAELSQQQIDAVAAYIQGLR